MDLLCYIRFRKWKRAIRSGFGGLAAALPVAMLAPSAGAAAPPVVNLTLAWDASPSPNVTNYSIYYGLSSGSYPNKVVAGNSTSVVISNLVVGTTYYFVATSVANNGLESAHSAEFAYAPVLPRVGARLQINVSATKQVTLSGTGPAGYAYDVLWSSNAMAWTRFTNVTVNASGTFALKDPAAATKPMSFYRLRQTSPANAAAVSAQFQVNVSPAGQVTLNGTGPAGYTYDAYWSSDTVTWTKFASLTVSAAGTFAVQDPTSATQPMRFYRLTPTSP